MPKLKVGDEIACSGCGEMFTLKHHIAKYCSTLCCKKARRKSLFKYNNSNKRKLHMKKWAKNNRDKCNANDAHYNDTQKGLDAEKRKKQVRKKRLENDPEFRAHHNAVCSAWRTKNYRENPDVRKKNSLDCKRRWSQKNYGIYAEAHRALLNLETQTKEIKDGT